jgi:serine protease Do
MNRRHPSCLPLTAAFALSLALTQPAGAASKALELARQLNAAFVEVADTVSRSVVVIEVEFKPEAEELDADANSWLDRLPDWFRRELLPEGGEDEVEAPPVPRRRPGRERQPMPGSGSGVIIREDGYILTNAHVVKDSQKIKVRLKDGREFAAEVRGIDELSEIAVIKLQGDGLTGLPVAKLADSDRVRVGEFAIAIGAPFALDYTVTVGHVSAKGRAEVVPRYMGGGNMDQDFIQTDANINPGNSGGPLVNLEGEVMGINTLIRGIGTGIGFAIPSNLARAVSDQLIQKGTFDRAWLGIGVQELSRHPAKETLAPNRQHGLVVESILAGGPAAGSELKPSDVITGINGKPVRALNELRSQVRSYPLGTTLDLTVIRAGKEMQIAVATGTIAEDVLMGRASRPRPAAPAPEVLPLGIKVEAITPNLARQYNLQQQSGVVITEVAEDSPAATSGLIPGLVITDLNHQPIKSLEDYQRLLSAADLTKGVLFNYVDAEGNSSFQVLKDE